MKKAVYIFGAVSADLIILGSLFKRMQWPGGTIMLVASGFTTAIFAVLLAIYIYKIDKNQ